MILSLSSGWTDPGSATTICPTAELPARTWRGAVRSKLVTGDDDEHPAASAARTAQDKTGMQARRGGLRIGIMHTETQESDDA
jgi:hypothetical protein